LVDRFLDFLDFLLVDRFLDLRLGDFLLVDLRLVFLDLRLGDLRLGDFLFGLTEATRLCDFCLTHLLFAVKRFPGGQILPVLVWVLYGAS
jgi:hypothetical protein